MDHTTYRLIIVGIFSILSFLSLALLRKKAALPVVFFVAVALGIYRGVQFAGYAMAGDSVYPIELSHIAYFTQAAILLSGIPQLQFFAGFFSFCCAVGYFIGAMASPASMMSGLDDFTIVQGMVIHGLLLFCGIVMLFGIRRYKKRALFYTVLGFVLLYLFAYLVKNDVLYPGVPKDSYVVLKMFDGSLLNYLFPEMTLTPMIETMTTVGLLLIAFLLSLGLYFANQKFFKGKEENILECGIYPWLKKYSADEDEIRR